MIRDMIRQYANDTGWPLSDERIGLLETLASELKKWNRRLNLTAITKESEIVIKHFIDSMHLAPYISDEDNLLDIGSGAGFPIIPLKIIKPETDMVSVDSVAKKINFQRHIIRLLGLQGIEALHVRGEELPERYAGKFSFITSRAFKRLDHFVALASPLLAKGGRLVAMKGEDADDEISVSRDTFQELGFAVNAIYHYNLPLNMGKHCLVEIKACEAA